jgi:haloacetate dehalogenase
MAGLERRRLPGDGIEVDALVGGSGPPLLLLHGYPQTRMVWRGVAAQLMNHFTLVIPDLRGYGRSDKPRDDPANQTYSKRTMARDQMATMAALGYRRFSVAGHDRGGRVAYRLALDHPEAVERLAVIDIVPTAQVFDAGMPVAMGLFHWAFLAQPYPLPERMLEASGDLFATHLFERWAAPGFRFDPVVLQDYLACMAQPESIHASCADYRAAWAVDRLDDLADRGQRKITQPLCVLWGNQGASHQNDPIAVWREWAEQPTGRGLPVGHFVPDEAPSDTAAALRDFFLQRSGA